MGGIGKTQVALEFVWQHYKKYNGVVWFNAENRDRLQNDYISLGRELKLIDDDDKIDAEERARYVKHWLEDPSRVGWLLVYDNVGNFKVIRELLPTKEGKILITSRHTADWPQEISIDVFTIEESRAYIHKVLDTPISESNIMQIEKIAETLGRLPLALAQATAYIKRTKVSISRYLELYEQKKRDLLNCKLLPSDYSASVYIGWDMIMKAIREVSILALNLLNICSYLASNNIPNFLLKEFAGNAVNNLNSEIFEEAREILICYSMLTYNGQNGNSSIHRLVQEVIRLKRGKEKTHNVMNIFNLLIYSFPYYGKTLAEYDKKLHLLPHLEAFSPHLETWQKVENKEEMCLLPLLICIFDGYHTFGNAQKSRELLERALTIQERHYGPDHPKVATTLVNLGSVYGSLGDAQKSRELLERALTINERHYGPDHPEVAPILTNLGIVYGSFGDAQKSVSRWNAH